MKKLKIFAATVLALCIALFAGACDKEKLNPPTGFNFDDAYTLFWSYVTDARSYAVEIAPRDGGEIREESTRYTYISLASLAEGDYSIRVRAVGGERNQLFSDWSKAIDFHRDKDSGLIFTAVNGNTEYEVTKVGTASGEVEIGATYRGKPVTSIADDAFRGKGSSKIEKVTVGANVRTIGSGAFYNCVKLSEVSIPDTVIQIGDSLFQGCTSLKTVNIPAGITQLPEYTFAYCSSLEQISIGDNITAIGESAFYGCSALKEVVIPDSVSYIGEHAFDAAASMKSLSLGSGLEQIDQYAFYSCGALEEISFAPLQYELTFGDRVFENCTSLASVELPEGLTAIGGYDFYRCAALERVTIPESVKSVGQFAFRDTALYTAQSAGGDGLIYADKWLLTATDELKKTVKSIAPEDLREGTVGIADWAFIVNVTEDGVTRSSGAPLLEGVELAASVRYVGVYAFYRCPQLSRFITERGSELKSVGERAFQDCKVLSNVRFYSDLEEIGSYAFYNCTMLRNNESNSNLVPETVTRIGTYAFNNTGMWAEAADADGIVYAGNWVVGFNNLTETAITFANTTVGVSDFAFYKNTEVQNITGLGRAEHIGRGAFFGCTALSLINLNPNLTRIEDNTFSDCNSLFLASFPLNLESIGLRAFYNCTLLDEIDLSATNVVSIDDYAFYGCYNVKSINFGEKLETIGDYAFYGLDRVQTLSLPDSVLSVGERAFSGCEALEEVSFGSSLIEIGYCAFMNCKALKKVAFPDSLEVIGNYAFYKCAALTEADFGNGVIAIGRYAFATAPLTSVVLPGSLEIIGEYAFKNCKQLVSVLMKGTPREIGAHAFCGSPLLTIYIAADREGASGWSARWNSLFRPAVWGCTLDEEGGYVVSVTFAFENVENPFARFGLSGPQRAGYDFAGWALTPDGEAVYGADEWRNAETGTTLYAVYTVHTEPEEPETPPETPPEAEGGENQAE